ncbi:unnamed protein product, partial [Owenia fusiformis]
LERCAKMTAFECRSAEYVQSKQICIISTSNRGDAGSTRTIGNMDYYERVEFSHETPVQVNGAYWVRKQGQYLPGNNDDKTEGLSLEECLERCINMAAFECKSA